MNNYMFINRCPDCNSDNLNRYREYKTLTYGNRWLYQCNHCARVFSETKGSFSEGIRKPIHLIVNVLMARSEGGGFNAVCRIFKIAKNTLLEWERKFADMKETLMLYALTHTFVSQTIEGDELYTKIRKNSPVEDCDGWTIVLMERASRLIWELHCGKRDRTLFLHAIQLVRMVIDRTSDVTLLTDGERRYGAILKSVKK